MYTICNLYVNGFNLTFGFWGHKFNCDNKFQVIAYPLLFIHHMTHLTFLRKASVWLHWMTLVSWSCQSTGTLGRHWQPAPPQSRAETVSGNHRALQQLQQSTCMVNTFSKITANKFNFTKTKQFTSKTDWIPLLKVIYTHKIQRTTNFILLRALIITAHAVDTSSQKDTITHLRANNLSHQNIMNSFQAREHFFRAKYPNDPKFRTGRSGQTVKTQIRLLLEGKSDKGLHCLLFHLLHFDTITLRFGLLVWILGRLQQIFLTSQNLGTLR